MATHLSQGRCGFSVYKGVLIQWDEDHDERIFLAIDEIPDSIRSRLVIAQEHEGTLALRWHAAIPSAYREAGVCVHVDGDVWPVESSLIHQESEA